MRRHLGLNPAEVDALPWWQFRMYVEGLQQEFGNPAAAPENERSFEDLVSDLGMKVRRH